MHGRDFHLMAVTLQWCIAGQVGFTYTIAPELIDFIAEGETVNVIYQVRVDDGQVETGRYRTLPNIPGSYLSDLIELANGEANTVSILGRRVSVGWRDFW